MPHQPIQRLLSTPVKQRGQNYLNLTELKVQTFPCLQHIMYFSGRFSVSAEKFSTNVLSWLLKVPTKAFL